MIDLPSLRCHDLPPHCRSDLPSLRCSDLPSLRYSDLPPHCCSDLPSLRCHDRREKMTRASMLLIVLLIAAVSYAADKNPCRREVKAKVLELVRAMEDCCIGYKLDMDKTTWNSYSKRKCNIYDSLNNYDVAGCDPLPYWCAKCVLKSKKLLKPDDTLDDAAFQKNLLSNKCSSETSFENAYTNCKSSSMQRLNFLKFMACIVQAIPGWPYY
ncbi:uncharacterized protein LOC108665245 [Hyalella azteca]|uniref:Uncharacterized protein LOC108665245 n=1 Tax=Hyalella azteca TaxID=294128 RepID=A0A8B7N2M8_HYAAZ|nr:uncharacterized protein LOC108665245 [Hyalella azteca]